MAYPVVPAIPPLGGTVSATLQNAQGGTSNVTGSTFTCTGMATVTLTNVPSSFGGTVTFKGSADGVNYINLYGIKLGSAVVATTSTPTSANEIWIFDVAGLNYMQAPLSNMGSNSGTITITAVGSALPTPFPLDAVPSGAPYPLGSSPITADSGNIAAATCTATLPGVAGKTTYITGFVLTSTGSTSAAVVAGSITGVVTGTLHFTYATVAGVTLTNQPLIVSLPYPIPASAVNTAIAVSIPSLGSGNTNTTIFAMGFQI